jgi:hypothetical protein
MAARDAQAGRPSWPLSPQSLSVTYGEAQFMSSTGEARASGWFGPLKPLAPIAPKDIAGRQFDFPSGYNIATPPRAFEPISFADLRALAETYDLLRLVIETRKDQIERIAWSLRPRSGTCGPGAARIAALTRFFEKPDGEHSFSVWLRMLLEDLFVIDAPALWRQRSRNGSLVALHPLDGASIKRVIDDWGRTPQPFDDGGAVVYPVAYQQILKGYPAVDYTTRDLLYAPRNLRAGRVYGFSPVEQIVMTVSIALKRQIFTLAHFTEGNIPESLIGVPENWTPDQIKNFQDYWDAYFSGDLATRRRAKFVPGGVAKTFIQTKEPELKNLFDEWLARVVCYAFSVSPQAFVNQANRATSETQKEMAEEEGLWPILKWVKRLIDGVLVEDLGEEEVEFAWGEDAQIEATQQAQVLTSYVNAGILTRNEARAKLGEAPVAEPAADALLVTTGSGPVALEANAANAQGLVKYNQYHDERGRFATADGAIAPSASEAGDRKPKPKGAQEAGILRELLRPLLPPMGGYRPPGQRQEPTLTDPPPPSFPSRPPETPKKRPPPAAEAPNEPTAGAGAPAPDPDDPKGSRGQDEVGSQRPQKPSYEIGASDGGPGKWVKANESLTPEEAAYQQKATGAPRGTVYNVSNPKAETGVTSFDGYDPATNTLIDAKYWNKWPIDEEFSYDSVVEQARSQITAAKGTKIVWRISSAEKAATVSNLLKEKALFNVTVEFFPP